MFDSFSRDINKLFSFCFLFFFSFGSTLTEWIWKYGLLERCDFIVVNQINSKVALCGGVKEITGKWEFSLWFWQLLYELSPAKNLKKSPDERLFRQVGRRLKGFLFKWWRRSIMVSLFILFWHFDMPVHSRMFVFLWRPPLRSFSPPHHTLLIIIIVVGYLACDRPAREGFDRLSAWRAGNIMVGPAIGTLHSTGQLSSVSGHMEPGDCRWHCLCSPQFSSLHSWLGTGGWWRWHLYAWSGFDLSARFVFIFTVM